MPPLAAKTFTTALRALEMHFPPLVAGATTFPHFVVGLWMLSHGTMSLQKSMEQFILTPEQGEVRRSRIGGDLPKANNSAEWLFCHMMQTG